MNARGDQGMKSSSGVVGGGPAASLVPEDVQQAAQNLFRALQEHPEALEALDGGGIDAGLSFPGGSSQNLASRFGSLFDDNMAFASGAQPNAAFSQVFDEIDDQPDGNKGYNTTNAAARKMKLGTKSGSFPRTAGATDDSGLGLQGENTQARPLDHQFVSPGSKTSSPTATGGPEQGGGPNQQLTKDQIKSAAQAQMQKVLFLSELPAEERRRMIEFLAVHKVNFQRDGSRFFSADLSLVGTDTQDSLKTNKKISNMVFESSRNATVVSSNEDRVRVYAEYDETQAYPLLDELVARYATSPSGLAATKKLSLNEASPDRPPVKNTGNLYRKDELVIPEVVFEQYRSFARLLFPPTNKLIDHKLSYLVALIDDIYASRYALETRKLRKDYVNSGKALAAGANGTTEEDEEASDEDGEGGANNLREQQSLVDRKRAGAALDYAPEIPGRTMGPGARNPHLLKNAMKLGDGPGSAAHFFTKKRAAGGFRPSVSSKMSKDKNTFVSEGYYSGAEAPGRDEVAEQRKHLDLVLKNAAMPLSESASGVRSADGPEDPYELLNSKRQENALFANGSPVSQKSIQRRYRANRQIDLSEETKRNQHLTDRNAHLREVDMNNDHMFAGTTTGGATTTSLEGGPTSTSNQFLPFNGSRDNPRLRQNDSSFPEFVLDYLLRRYGHVSGKLVNQRAWDLIHMVEEYRSEFVYVKIFGLFLREVYGKQDLLFYLFVRRCIQREQNQFVTTTGGGTSSSQIVKTSGSGMPLKWSADKASSSFLSNSGKGPKIGMDIPFKVSENDFFSTGGVGRGKKITDRVPSLHQLYNGRLISGVSSALCRTHGLHFLTVGQCYAAGAQIFAKHPKLKRGFQVKLHAEFARLQANISEEIEQSLEDECRRLITQGSAREYQEHLARKKSTHMRRFFFPVELLEALALQHYYSEKTRCEMVIAEKKAKEESQRRALVKQEEAKAGVRFALSRPDKASAIKEALMYSSSSALEMSTSSSGAGATSNMLLPTTSGTTSPGNSGAAAAAVDGVSTSAPGGGAGGAGMAGLLAGLKSAKKKPLAKKAGAISDSEQQSSSSTGTGKVKKKQAVQIVSSSEHHSADDADDRHSAAALARRTKLAKGVEVAENRKTLAEKAVGTAEAKLKEDTEKRDLVLRDIGGPKLLISFMNAEKKQGLSSPAGSSSSPDQQSDSFTASSQTAVSEAFQEFLKLPAVGTSADALELRRAELVDFQTKVLSGKQTLATAKQTLAEAAAAVKKRKLLVANADKKKAAAKGNSSSSPSSAAEQAEMKKEQAKSAFRNPGEQQNEIDEELQFARQVIPNAAANVQPVLAALEKRHGLAEQHKDEFARRLEELDQGLEKMVLLSLDDLLQCHAKKSGGLEVVQQERREAVGAFRRLLQKQEMYLQCLHIADSSLERLPGAGSSAKKILTTTELTQQMVEYSTSTSSGIVVAVPPSKPKDNVLGTKNNAHAPAGKQEREEQVVDPPTIAERVAKEYIPHIHTMVEETVQELRDAARNAGAITSGVRAGAVLNDARLLVVRDGEAPASQATNLNDDMILKILRDVFQKIHDQMQVQATLISRANANLALVERVTSAMTALANGDANYRTLAQTCADLLAPIAGSSSGETNQNQQPRGLGGKMLSEVVRSDPKSSDEVARKHGKIQQLLTVVAAYREHLELLRKKQDLQIRGIRRQVEELHENRGTLLSSDLQNLMGQRSERLLPNKRVLAHSLFNSSYFSADLPVEFQVDEDCIAQLNAIRKIFANMASQSLSASPLSKQDQQLQRSRRVETAVSEITSEMLAGLQRYPTKKSEILIDARLVPSTPGPSSLSPTSRLSNKTANPLITAEDSLSNESRRRESLLLGQQGAKRFAEFQANFELLAIGSKFSCDFFRPKKIENVFRQHPYRNIVPGDPTYRAMCDKLRTRMETALGLYDIAKSEKLHSRLMHWSTVLLDMHLKEISQLKQLRFRQISKTDFLVDAKYWLQIYLKYHFHMLLRKFTLPDLILQQELMRDLWDLVWELTVHLSKGQLEEAQKILPHVPMKSKTLTAEDFQTGRMQGRSQLNSSEVSTESLEDLHFMSKLVLKENLQPGRLPMTCDFAAHFCSCVVDHMASRIEELIEYKFAQY
ncbi:unnamed protein product [Amoebophrya sp. A120]|nr:unnamed protein product [Amoebophrya sp. A120]|eukprot:GSA120T00001049001.1